MNPPLLPPLLLSVCLFLISISSVSAGVKKTLESPIASQPVSHVIKEVDGYESYSGPIPIDESEQSRHCPPDFHPLGNQCAKVISINPDIHCPTNYVLTDDQCARFVGKGSECPPGFTRRPSVNSRIECFRSSRTEADIACPVGFVLNGETEDCVKTIPLPQIAYCAHGSVARGDGCSREERVAAELVCPTGGTVQGNQCVSEDVYDCTPARDAEHQPAVQQQTASVKPGGGRRSAAATLRRLAKREKTYDQYNVFSPPPISETEYVMSKMCKKVRYEPVRKVCPQGMLVGKVCVFDIMEGPSYKDGGYGEERAPAEAVCPPNFTNTCEKSPYIHAKSRKCACLLNEEAPAVYFCPPGTVDVGTKCATYSPISISCPSGYMVENGQCHKTVIAPAIVEYTITYQCTGAGCAETGRKEGQHHHKILSEADHQK